MKKMLLLLSLLIITGCGPSIESIHQTLKGGKIQENGSVVAIEQIEINAPAEKIWNLLSGIDNWKKWVPNVTESKLNGTLAVDTKFDWVNDGTDIHSTIAILEKNKIIGWSGVASIAKAAHIYRLKEKDGKTIVQTEESFDGFMISVFFGKDKLSASLTESLQQLKKTAEQ